MTLLERWTRLAARRPWLVLAGTLAALALVWGVASRLEVHSGFVDLLPSDSVAAQRFLSTLGRKGGAASTLIVVVEGRDEAAGRALIDRLEAGVRRFPPGLVGVVEHGPAETRAFFDRWRWLFADEDDLARIDCEISRERAHHVPGYVELEDPCAELHAQGGAPLDNTGLARPQQGAPPLGAEPGAPAGESTLQAFERRVEARVAALDRFPSGYFRDETGEHHLLILRSPAGGLDPGGERLEETVKRLVASLHPERAHLEVGLAGDIPNAIAERDALVENMTTVSVVAVALVLFSIVAYFRSPLSLVHVGLAVFLGTGAAFAVAELAYGHLNAATSFLGSIVFGNGINHGIVHFDRYLEKRGAGATVEDALVDAALVCRRGTWLAAVAGGGAYAAPSFLGSIVFGNGINHGIVHFDRYLEKRGAGATVEDALVDAALVCRRGTWLAAVAGGGAYAALLVTSFRGFSEFGLIGGVGMLACWLATFAVGPASIAAAERVRETRVWRALSLASLRAPAAPEKKDAFASRPVARRVAKAVAVLAWPIAAAAVAGAVYAALPLRDYFRDPWEYDFAKLRSESTARSGAGRWSSVVDRVLASRGAPQMLLADDMGQVLRVAEELRASDRRVTGGRYVQRIETIYDRLGGPPEVVARKLERLADIREELDAVLPHLEGEDARIAREWRPPDDLRALAPDDLPALVRDQFTENDGRVGTPLYVSLAPDVSQSDGHNLLRIARVLEGVRLPDGRVVPNASMSAIFAEMIRAMERDGPRATLFAFVLVLGLALLVTRKAGPALAVIVSLVTGVLFTVGAAARLDERLNFLNFVALPLTFGIGVEYAINLYERVRTENGDAIAGLRSGGGAILLCSLTTTLGYGALLFADNRALASFGRYAIGGELACVVTALLLLPAVLHLARKR